MAPRAQTTDTPPETTTETTTAAKADESTPDPAEFVNIRLKGQGEDVTPGRVTRKSFDRQWAKKGYEIVEPASVTATEGDSSE